LIDIVTAKIANCNGLCDNGTYTFTISEVKSELGLSLIASDLISELDLTAKLDFWDV
jgi:hypothetical protein